MEKRKKTGRFVTSLSAFSDMKLFECISRVRNRSIGSVLAENLSIVSLRQRVKHTAQSKKAMNISIFPFILLINL